MLEHQDALESVLSFSKSMPAVYSPLDAARGRVLSKDIKASFPLPSFNNSAVDGYAIRFPFCHSESNKVYGAKNLKERSDPPRTLADASLPPKRWRARPPRRASRMTNDFEFKVVGEIAAGEVRVPKLISGTAVQIFTGAPVPRGTHAVVMQENVILEKHHVKLSSVPRGSENIRFTGEDIPKGKLLLKKGVILGASQIGLLAAAGIAQVPVIRKPQVTILATGNELKQPGEKLKPGQIFDSNTHLLCALAEENECLAVPLSAGQDNRPSLKKKIRQGLKADVFLIAGGVSVGKYDLVKEILREEGVREIFWKVNIKPGKPLFFGLKGKTLVFGLPGNPVSVFVTFTEYVKPALQKLQGKKTQPVFEKARMTEGYQNGPRRHFVRCFYTKTESTACVTALSGQGSHMIHSLAQANALLEVAPNGFIRKNQEVQVQLFEATL